jgi:hypothetical protein
MDSFTLCVALVPLAVYLLFLAVLNLRNRPSILTGGQDVTALGIGVSGLVFVGPIELLLPYTAFQKWQFFVWPMLGVMYALGLALIVLLSRPRLVIYNISANEVRPLVAEAISGLDADARWAGNSLVLPRLHVELHLDFNAALCNVTLVATHDEQSFAGWRRLAAALRQALRPSHVAPRAWGIGVLLAALAMLGAVGWQLVADPQAIEQGLRAMLRL